MTSQPLRGRRELKRMVANSGWLSVGTGVRLVVGFVTSVWVTRYLGPESFGVYSYVLAMVAIFAAVSSLGMHALVTRELVGDPEHRHEILGSAAAIRSAGSLVAAMVLTAVALVFHPEIDVRIGLVIFGLTLFFQPLGVVQLFYESKTQSRYVVAVQVVATFVYLVLAVLFIQWGLSVIWFLVARLIEAAVANFGALAVFARQGYRPSKWRAEKARTRSLLGQSWPLIISSVGAIFYLRIDQVMLGWLASSSDVGVYAAATRISELWYVLPGIAMVSAFPYLLRLRERDASVYELRLQQMYDVLMWTAVGIAVVVTFAAGAIVSILYGDPYSASAPILQIHIWAAVFVFMRAAFSKWLVAEALLPFSMVTQVSGAVVNIALNAVLIPKWGGQGAAWATVLSYAVAGYFSLMLFRSTRPAAWMMTRTLSAPIRMLRSGAPRTPADE